MQTKQTMNISDEVAETLFITLYVRCLETRRDDAILRDPEACRIVESVDFDFSKFAKSQNTQMGVSIRARYFDNITRRFIETHATPVIISIGCGLDTRSSRIGGDKGVFYNLDLPEVMEIRDKLLPPDAQNISLRGSLFDTAWADTIREKHPDADILVLAEGVLIYFPEEEVRSVLTSITNILSPKEVVFDAGTSLLCKKSKQHETVKHTNAVFRWALNDDRLPETWMPGLHLLDVCYVMDKERQRMSLFYRLMGLFPFFGKAYRMLHYGVAPR